MLVGCLTRLHLLAHLGHIVHLQVMFYKLYILNDYWNLRDRGVGRVVRWCWVNFQCRGVLQFGYSRARAYCACSRCGWGLFGHFTLIYPFSPLSPSLWETARYRLKYCLKGPLNPNQPTNQPSKRSTNYGVNLYCLDS